MLGDTAILKVFRRLELGRNLDIEVHAALNAAQIDDVARLYGWIEGGWVSGGRHHDTDLGMVVQKLADAEDGWGLALDRLRQQQSFVEDAQALGQALAETHDALRAAFPTARVLGAHTASVMTDRLTAAAEVAPDLLTYRDGLAACFDALGGEILDTQRVHGDFHLGQTLHTPHGWKIIDFEGEPAKTMAERRAPDSVWRDVAGMLRSFDYAAASVPGPGSSDWAAACRRSFLDGYSGGRLSEAQAAALRAYEADKAIYEVVYEVRNRPDWVSIPLGAVATLAAGAANTSNSAAAAADTTKPPQSETEFFFRGVPPEPPEIKE
jgi:maltokinase